jgi:hypothetical protein
MTTKDKSADEPKKSVPVEQKKIDQQVEDSFPASDPPSYAGGKHSIGEPPRPDKHDKKASNK